MVWLLGAAIVAVLYPYVIFPAVLAVIGRKPETPSEPAELPESEQLQLQPVPATAAVSLAGAAGRSGTRSGLAVADPDQYAKLQSVYSAAATRLAFWTDSRRRAGPRIVGDSRRRRSERAR